MSYSGDAAEQVVRMTLEGAEFAAKITGAGAKQLAVLLYAVLRDQKKTKGKIRLGNMIKSGKELKVFTVKDPDLQRFCAEAKKYGILYCVLKDRSANDGISDIMVRAEDASKINRIFERFKLTTVDIGNVKSEIQRSREETSGVHSAQNTKNIQISQDDNMQLQPAPENPRGARAQKSHQSEPISKAKDTDAMGTFDDHKQRNPSVRQELNEIKNEQQRTEKAAPPALPSKSANHKKPTKKKRKKQKEL